MIELISFYAIFHGHAMNWVAGQSLPLQRNKVPVTRNAGTACHGRSGTRFDGKQKYTSPGPAAMKNIPLPCRVHANLCSKRLGED